MLRICHLDIFHAVLEELKLTRLEEVQASTRAVVDMVRLSDHQGSSSIAGFHCLALGSIACVAMLQHW